MVDFVTDNRQLVQVAEVQDLEHVLLAEDGAHGVGGVDQEQELALGRQDLREVLQVDLVVLLGSQPVVDDIDSQSGAQLLE